MNHQKMLDIMDEVNSEAVEREELTECIALALLSRKNLFILGDTGQAKSFCINEFRKRITGAKAYLRGDSEACAKDLLVLKNYFWNSPEEIPTVVKILTDICENPVGAEVEKYLAMAYESLSEMETDMQSDSENLKPYVKFSKELLRIYTEVVNLKLPDMNDADAREIEKGAAELEEISVKADKAAKTQHITMAERKRLNV